MRNSGCQLLTILAVAALSGNGLTAKDKHPKSAPAKPQDQIQVEAHITVSGGPVTRFVATRHYDRSYVYAERETGKPVTLIDLSNPSQPHVLSDASLPAPSSSLLAVAGTAALTGDAPATAMPQPQTIRLMDFSDPINPKVTRQFDGVTAVENIGGGVILLANAEGIWVLSQRFAEDPSVQERYARQVIYGPSMY
jgi:hypothetical protein